MSFDASAAPGVVRLAGELDEATVEHAQRALEEALAAAPAQLTVDVSELQFMDSAGIWLLVDAQRRCVERGIELRLGAQRRPAVARALSMSGVDDLIQAPGAHPSGEVALRLYVAGTSAASAAVVADVRALAERLPGRLEVEVVDVAQEPERAERDRIIATPTLIRVRPAPELRLIGAVGDPHALLAQLGLS
jgi:circadian clock protein KaiB